ncbi:MAG TPA: hypothetical protein VN026_02445 [Bacteroidia bacterium]|jgi:hypothetical protein|nr:hypothetical protein [Bacteroidia bacterium]
MFILKHIRAKKLVKSSEYETREEAENNIEDDLIDADQYQIYDTLVKGVVDDGFLESNDSKIESTIEMMFPNKGDDY